MASKRTTPSSSKRITRSGIQWSRKWNWDGDRILHGAIVPSQRPPIGRATGGYDIDVREFLISERNAVMRRTIEEDVHAFVKKTKGASLDLFTARKEKSFDHRADMIAAFVGGHIAYRYGGAYDPWQFPDETLALREGDCEDRALLLASLLLASGISSFNVRVALGQFITWFDKGPRKVNGHCWVMYKNEAGQWLVLEPTQARTIRSARVRAGAPLPVRAEYRPMYLFNDEHLWGVGDAAKPEAGRPDLKRDWSRVHPEFAGIVHKSILNEALSSVGCPQWVLDKLNRNFTSWLGKPELTTDSIDLNLATYDPRDHFDNGYIDDSWGRVATNLDAFAKDPPANLDAFFHAAHGISDLYAHSTYAHFAAKANAATIPLFDPANPTPNRKADYGAGSDIDFTSGRFSMNPKVWKGTPQEAAASWKDKIISGRYAQHGDSHNTIEWATAIPRELKRRADFPKRGSLPHHNEIAVDARDKEAGHLLYTDAEYARQYALRYDAAKRHIAQAFKQRWVAS